MYRKLPFVLFAELPSGFNVEAFANSSFEGQGDTRRIRIEPKEYNAQVVGPWGEKTKLRMEKGKDGVPHLILDVVWQPDDEEQRRTLGIEKLPTVRQSIFLDLTPSGNLDMGQLKNGDLNRLRDVFDLNQDGVQWKFPDFIGRPAKIKVVQKPNKDDPENPFTNVTAVSKIG